MTIDLTSLTNDLKVGNGKDFSVNYAINPFNDQQLTLHQTQRFKYSNRIIDRYLQQLAKIQIAGLDFVRQYLYRLYRKNCRHNTIRAYAGTISNFCEFLKMQGKKGCDAVSMTADKMTLGAVCAC